MATAPVLKLWSSIKEFHVRLRELFRRLCEYEHVAAKKQKEEEYVEGRRKHLALATGPVMPKILPVQFNPQKWSEIITWSTTCPPAPWCELCVMGRGKDDPRLRGDLREKGEQLLSILVS